MSNLEILWFVLIVILFVGFFLLEGYDFGVGMVHLLVSEEEEERALIIHTIAPVWDGNEVWLIGAIGGMFASFPIWYGTFLSGYYPLIVLLIVSLVVRGLALHFGGRMKSKRGNQLWSYGLAISSGLIPFFLAVVFASMSSGVSMTTDGHINSSIFGYFSFYSLSIGLAMVSICMLHGLNYLQLRTKGELYDKVVKLKKNGIQWTIIISLIAAFFATLQTPYFHTHPIYAIFLILLMLGGLVLHLFKPNMSDWACFASSSVTIGALVVLLLTGNFPNLIISKTATIANLTIAEAASGPYTLSLMTKVALVLLPIILFYQAYSFYIFRKRISSKDDIGFYL